MATAAVRSLRTAALDALQAGVPLVGGRVYTGNVPTGATFPYLTVGSYSEDESNFFGRSGSESGFDVKGFCVCPLGDKELLAVWEQCYAALHRQPLAVADHQHVTGTLRFVAEYPDPDEPTVLQFVARYEAETRVAA